jgi:hypothetical protein
LVSFLWQEKERGYIIKELSHKLIFFTLTKPTTTVYFSFHALSLPLPHSTRNRDLASDKRSEQERGLGGGEESGVDEEVFVTSTCPLDL